MPPAYYNYEDKEVIKFYSKIVHAHPESEIILYSGFMNFFLHKIYLKNFLELLRNQGH